MSTSRATVDHLLEQLEPLPVRARAMFGEHALYCDEKVVALICDDTVFLKPTAASDGLAEGPPYPGAKPYRIADDAVIADAERFQALVRATADALPPPKPRRAR
ncbi:TfoX/Sxy family protein [Demequina gelatinilytica]|uniref:TfoX/Sxy family protein n=1 Tax=Demequina gelatinilytica TaxID=1638980 RepID=UPI000780A266|nr:TfoX/Sxy family protein [Demequina gelatinilytica]